jgi:hypothetical protein
MPALFSVLFVLLPLTAISSLISGSILMYRAQSSLQNRLGNMIGAISAYGIVVTSMVAWIQLFFQMK